MSNYPKYEKYAKYHKGKKPSYPERFKEFLQSAKRVLKVATKPDRKEYFLVFKICTIGIVIIGALYYVLQLIFSFVGQVFWPAPTS